MISCVKMSIMCFVCVCVYVMQLDSWSVILNGAVEVLYPNDHCETVGMGGSFGVSPSMEKELMVGIMKTKVDDCQVCVWGFLFSSENISNKDYYDHFFWTLL